MNVKHFSVFIRTMFPDVPMKDEVVVEVGKRFKEYLEKIYANDKEKLELILDINPMHVMLHRANQNKTKGYHPELILHFTQYLKEYGKK